MDVECRDVALVTTEAEPSVLHLILGDVAFVGTTEIFPGRPSLW